MTKKYLAISGSLREKSFNSMLLHATKTLVPADMEIEIINISNIPLFNQDLEADMPQAVKDLKDKIIKSDGIIFSTPEYNRSIPGVLKNVIDWASRPHGQNAFTGKSALVLGASIGAVGTAVAQSHLKQILLTVDMHVLGQPEFYVGMAKDKFDREGNLTDEATKERIVKALDKLKTR